MNNLSQYHLCGQTCANTGQQRALFIHSPISVWEILLLAEKRRVSFDGNIEKSVRQIFQQLPLKEASLNHEVAIQSRNVRLPHQDPVDRFLAATAIVYDYRLVTADSRIIAAPEIPVLAAV